MGTPRRAYGSSRARFVSAQPRARPSCPFEIAGRPQHASPGATVTAYPSASSTRTAARPTSGWKYSVNVSTR